MLNHLISSILISVFFPCHPAVSDSLLLKPLAENLVRNALVGMAQQGGPYPMTTSFGVSASGIWWCKTPMLHGAQCSSRSKMRFCKFAVKDFADCILTSKGGDELCEFLQPHWGWGEWDKGESAVRGARTEGGLPLMPPAKAYKFLQQKHVGSTQQFSPMRSDHLVPTEMDRAKMCQIYYRYTLVCVNDIQIQPIIIIDWLWCVMILQASNPINYRWVLAIFTGFSQETQNVMWKECPRIPKISWSYNIWSSFVHQQGGHAQNCRQLISVPSIRWNSFFQKLNGIIHTPAFHKLRASSCTHELRASQKHKFKLKHANKCI